MSSKTLLSQQQTALAALQTAFWEKSRREGLAVAKIKEVDIVHMHHSFNFFVIFAADFYGTFFLG